MRFAQTTAARRSVNITPLIDVIFLLVLFFLLASVFARHGALAISARGASDTAATSEPRPVALVRVAQGGVTDINGVAVETSALLGSLAALGDRQVVLLARTGVSLQDYVDVLEMLQGAGHNVQIGAAP